MQRLLVLGPQPPTQRRKHPLSVHYDGFDLHAGLAIRARRRTMLERVLRYGRARASDLPLRDADPPATLAPRTRFALGHA